MHACVGVVLTGPADAGAEAVYREAAGRMARHRMPDCECVPEGLGRPPHRDPDCRYGCWAADGPDDHGSWSWDGWEVGGRYCGWATGRPRARPSLAELLDACPPGHPDRPGRVLATQPAAVATNTAGVAAALAAGRVPFALVTAAGDWVEGDGGDDRPVRAAMAAAGDARMLVIDIHF